MIHYECEIEMTKIGLWDFRENIVIKKRIDQFKKGFSERGLKILSYDGYGLHDGFYHFDARNESFSDFNAYQTMQLRTDPYFKYDCNYLTKKIYNYSLFEKEEEEKLIIINEALNSLVNARLAVLLESFGENVCKFYAIEIPVENKHIPIISRTLNFDEDELFENNFKRIILEYFDIDLDVFSEKIEVIRTLEYIKMTCY